MDEDLGDPEGEKVALDVTVARTLIEEIDELAAAFEYSKRSEFVEAILRDATEPTLTAGARVGMAKGYTDVAMGRTMSTDEARERLRMNKD